MLVEISGWGWMRLVRGRSQVSVNVPDSEATGFSESLNRNPIILRIQNQGVLNQVPTVSG